MLKIKEAFIQIAKEPRPEKIQITMQHSEGYDCLHIEWYGTRKNGEMVRKQMNLFVGQDGIENMAHGLAVGIIKCLGLNVV